MKVRVLIVDGDVKYLRELVPVLARKCKVDLVGIAKTYQEALLSIKELQPDVMLTDFDLDGGSGLDLIRDARKSQPKLQTIILTEKRTQPDLFNALGVGAKGYVLKNSTAIEICQYLDQLLAGGSPITPYMARWLVDNVNDLNQTVEGRPVLSKQELAILTLLSKGYSREEMAGIHQISQNTVATYIKRIYKKLGVRSKTEAVFEAVQLGLITIK